MPGLRIATRCEGILFVDHMTYNSRRCSRRCASSGPKASSPSGRQPYRAGGQPRLAKDEGRRDRLVMITGLATRQAIGVAELRTACWCPAGR